MKNVEVEVDVQKGALGLKYFSDNRCVSNMQFMFSSIVVRW